MNKERIILASASPRRRELLSQIGIEYEVMPSDAEEKTQMSRPEEIVMELSRKKAADIEGRLEAKGEDGFLIIGADTVVASDGRILGKPKDREDALRMLRMLQGKTHQVITGVAVILEDKKKTVNFAEVTKVYVCPMTEEQIERYVDTGEPMDKAGAYGIQGRFAAYVSGIEGDYNNVVGLPVARLYQELLAEGTDLLCPADRRERSKEQ